MRLIKYTVSVHYKNSDGNDEWLVHYCENEEEVERAVKSFEERGFEESEIIVKFQNNA